MENKSGIFVKSSLSDRFHRSGAGIVFSLAFIPMWFIIALIGEIMLETPIDFADPLFLILTGIIIASSVVGAFASFMLRKMIIADEHFVESLIKESKTNESE